MPRVASVQPTVTGLCLLVSRDVTSDLGDTTQQIMRSGCLPVKRAYPVRWRLLSAAVSAIARGAVRLPGTVLHTGSSRAIGLVGVTRG